MNPKPTPGGKHRQLQALLDRHQADALLLHTQATVGWYLNGARVHVSLAGGPIARVLVHRTGAHVATVLAEAGRLASEELPDEAGLEVHGLDWYADLDRVEDWCPEAAHWKILAEDRVGGELRALRQVLDDTEISAYRQLCRDAAALMTDALQDAVPEQTELQLAARMAAAAIEAGGDPLVLLVAGAERQAYRHPLPTDARLGERAMAVLCLRRHGLIANLTRWVQFQAPDPRQVRDEHAILEVEAEILTALHPGRTLGSLFPLVQRAYPRHGFDAREIFRHHQGGIAGYNGRDPRLTPQAPDLLQASQAFAWNPSAVGAGGHTVKVEDTVLLNAAGGLEVLSLDERWPTVKVGALQRPLALPRW